MGITHRIAGPQEGADRGHGKPLHRADLRIEAWGPTREECIAEAERGLVDSFAVVAGPAVACSGRAAHDSPHR